MNTTDFLNIATAICPDQTAIVFEGERYTFSELSDRVNRLANGLLKLGIQKGDRVGLLAVNCNQCVETYFAIAKIGAIYVPLNFRAKGDEVAYILKSSEAVALFVGDRYIDLINSLRPELDPNMLYISVNGEAENMEDYEAIINSSPGDDVITEIDDNDTTILMYTAGTTGFPKGVMLPHISFTMYVLENVTPASPEVEERNILTVPLYHVAGIQAMMAAIYGGRTLIMERQFEASEWMGLVQKEKANRAMIVPTMLKQILDHPDFGKYDLSSLKVITYGAAPMPLPVIRKALEVFPGVGFINAFGQTETASTISSLTPEDHILTGTEEEREEKLKRLSSIGKPMSDVEMKVIDEDGNDLAPGEVGEIVARGPRVMSGYWKDEEKTSKTIDADGWIHTGDMGYMDDHGYFYLAGRATDMIIRGGENISPEEVEIVLLQHPDIEECAIIGIPDEEWGEEPMAVVVAKKEKEVTEDEIIQFCRARLASFKRPRSVVFTDTLPRNQMGKVLKRELREKYGKPQE